MRYISSIIFITLLFIYGCMEGYDLNKTVSVYGYDFTKYSAKGFLFTPEPYNGEYKSIGLIEVTIYPPVSRMKIPEPKSFDTWHNQNYKQGEWYIGSISANEVLDSLYNYTKNMGADAVVNLQITDAEPKTNGVVYITGVKASGFAIKRK